MVQERHSDVAPRQPRRNLSDKERAPIEAENGLRQFDRLIEILEEYLAERARVPGHKFHLRLWMISELNRLAVAGLTDNPGNPRQAAMTIKGSSHQPPTWERVPYYLDEMVDYVNSNWSRSGVHLAAYVMWRLNWIHPYDDGNGRTARAVSYLVLCARLPARLPGERTIPELIAENKGPYYEALEAADIADAEDRIDVSQVEQIWRDALAEQIRLASEEETRASALAPPGHEAEPRPDVDISSFLQDQQNDEPAKDRRVKIIVGLIGAFGIVVAAVIGSMKWAGGSAEARCVPGETSAGACECAGLETGKRTCSKDGRRYECDCPVSPAAKGAAIPRPLVGGTDSVVDAGAVDGSSR